MRRAILFLFPALLLIGVFVLYPTVETVRWSFWSWDGRTMTGFGGIDNYVRIFENRDFFNPERFPTRPPPYGAVIHNILWAMIFIPATAFLGLILAVLLRPVRGGAIMRSMIFLGMVVPMVIGGIVIRFMYEKDAGIVNGLLGLAGFGSFTRTWTAYPNTALVALILGTVWIWTGFALIIYSAGLELIPGDLYESAVVDGASRWKVFWRITVPMLRPASLIVVIMSLIYVLRIFDIVYVSTLGGPGGASTVLGLLMYFAAFYKIPPDIGSASAIATFLTLLAAVISVFLVRRMT